MNNGMKKKSFPFTYDVNTVVKIIKKFYHVGKLRIIGTCQDGVEVVACGNKDIIDDETIAKIFGGVGGYYEGYEYVNPRIEWEMNGKKIVGLRVWKDILTWDEFRSVMRSHNSGFADKGNPDVMTGVIVYSPSASDWYRNLWDCDFEDRAYSCNSNGEIFLEKDPSEGLCRHPHCVLTSLRGDRAHGGHTLLRPNSDWVVDYCFVVED